MERWEYDVLTSNFNNAQETAALCNNMGAQGWECFAVYGAGPLTWLYFKRKLGVASAGVEVEGLSGPAVG